MIYRTRRPLETKTGKIIRSGKAFVFDEKEIKKSAIDKLLELDIVYEVMTPPLRVLEGWDERAKLLGKKRIRTVADFLLADNERLISTLDMTNEEIDNVKRSFIELLSSPKPKSG